MLKLKKIAITGLVASGKSTVLEFFQELGAFTLKCDDIVHEALNSNEILKKKVVNLLGNEIFTKGSINREKIAKYVFGNIEKLGELEKLTHPIVLKEIITFYNRACKNPCFPLFFVEIPLFFESTCTKEFRKFFDNVILVVCEEQLAKKRFPKKAFAKRRQRLLPDEEKKVDFIIKNNESKELLKLQTNNLYQQLI